MIVLYAVLLALFGAGGGMLFLEARAELAALRERQAALRLLLPSDREAQRRSAFRHPRDSTETVLDAHMERAAGSQPDRREEVDGPRVFGGDARGDFVLGDQHQVHGARVLPWSALARGKGVPDLPAVPGPVGLAD